jgi:hypothetical protein
MIRITALCLLLVGSAALAAPAPLPRPPKAKPKPKQVREFWEVDFSPMATAGRVNLGIELHVRTADGNGRRMSVGQGGQVLIAPIIDAFASHFDGADLVIDPGKTRMTIKSLKGIPVHSVEVTMRNLDARFHPVVLSPTKR